MDVSRSRDLFFFSHHLEIGEIWDVRQGEDLFFLVITSKSGKFGTCAGVKTFFFSLRSVGVNNTTLNCQGVNETKKVKNPCNKSEV